MKTYLILTLILLSFFSCNQTPEYRNDEIIIALEPDLGRNKTTDLINALESFDKFIADNFSDSLTNNEKIIEFLKQHKEYCDFEAKKWKFDYAKNMQLINDFEASGLRKDFWLYGYERDQNTKDQIDIIQIIDTNSRDQLKGGLDLENDDISASDNSIIEKRLIEDSIRFSKMQFKADNSQLIQTLNNLGVTDSTIISYLEARKIAGNISLRLLVDGLLSCADYYDYDNTLMKIILIDEIYSGIIYSCEEKD